MIDFTRERIVTLPEAAKRIPRRRAGRKASTSTPYRWSTTGCRGVFLETIQIGGTRCTSIEAMDRFFAKLTALSAGGEMPPSRSAVQHQEAVARELDDQGID